MIEYIFNEKENLALERVLRQRFTSRVPKDLLGLLSQKCTETLYLAGNSLNAEQPNDLDLYFSSRSDWYTARECLSASELYIEVCKTANAATYKRAQDGLLIQLCSYTKPSLKELCDSFDFSHVQIGVAYDFQQDQITEVYASPSYITWRLTSVIEFMGTEYPLSSLLRVEKYLERGQMTCAQYRRICLKILASIITRGFPDYEDFKDQLAAVDLMLDDASDAAWSLFEACDERGLV